MPFSTLSDFVNLGSVSERAIAGNEGLATVYLEAANSEMLGYFRAAKPPIDVPIPPASVSPKMKQVECQIAAWSFMGEIGFDPTSKSDEIYLVNYDKAVKWLEGVSAGKIQPLPVVNGVAQDGDPNTTGGCIVVESDSPRGW
jgi:phage gp36-like protein